MRRVLVRSVGMLRGAPVNMRVASRLALRPSRWWVVRYWPRLSCLACVVRRRCIRPQAFAVSIHRVRRPFISTETSARLRRIPGRAISAMVVATLRDPLPTAVVSTFITPFRWTIAAMLHFPFAARRYHVTVEITRPRAGRHCWPAVIHGRPLRTIRPRCMFVLDLLSSGFEVMLARGNSFVLAFAHLNSARPAIVAHAIDVVHHHRSIVVVVNHRHVNVGHRAIVHKFSSAPFAAPETHARVSVTIINSAVKANVWSPVTAVPNI